MREIVESAWKGAYCAFKNDTGIPEEYRKNLETIRDNGDFTVYRVLVEDKIRTVNYKDLPLTTKNGAKWSEKEHIIMSRSGVKVLFDEVVSGKEITVALDSSDSYRLTFFKENNETASILVMPEKNRFGMFNHTKKLPETIAENGFDAIKIVPVESDGSCSLGAIKID